MSSYNTNLDKNAANYVPLTPLTFIKRAKEIYPDYEALIYEEHNLQRFYLNQCCKNSF